MERFYANFEKQIYQDDADRIELLVEKGYLQELTELNQWVCWKSEFQGNRKTKPPYDPKTSRYADTTDPDTWGTFRQALNAYRSGNFQGLGFVITPSDPFVFIDIDKVVAENRSIYQPALRLIEIIPATCEIGEYQSCRERFYPRSVNLFHLSLSVFIGCHLSLWLSYRLSVVTRE